MIGKTRLEPFHRQTVDLLDLCISITDCHHSTPVYLDKGKLVIRNFNIKGGRLLLDNLSYTDKEHFDQRISRAVPEAGDLIITREAPMGEVCMIPEGVECCLGQRMVLIKPDKTKVSSEFLLFALQSEFVQKQIIQSDKTGSIVSNLRIPVLKALQIPRLGIQSETSIGYTLSNIVQKIELNNRINAELESMAKLIYDYWFVQFDYPDENGNPYRSSGGKMVYSEELKREIPDGWVIEHLEQLIDIYDSERIPLSKSEREKRKGTYPYFGATGILDYVDDFIFDGEYILLAEDGSVMNEEGNPIVQFIWGKTWVNNHAHVIRAKKEELNEYIFQALSRIPVVLIKSGSIQMKINQRNLLSFSIVKPPEYLMLNYSNKVKAFREMMMKNIDENQQLAALRDWLLPMLMNGQVTIKN